MPVWPTGVHCGNFNFKLTFHFLVRTLSSSSALSQKYIYIISVNGGKMVFYFSAFAVIACLLFIFIVIIHNFLDYFLDSLLKHLL